MSQYRHDAAWLRGVYDTAILPAAEGPLRAELERLAEQTYEMPPERREESLASLYAYAWARSGLKDVVAGALAQYPDLPVSTLCLGHPKDFEGAFLSRDRRAILVCVRPERLRDREAFLRWLRHELQRAADMLDPTFGYPHEPSGWPTGPYANLIRDRYGLLWGIWTDGRIERRGREPMSPADEWRRGFDRLFANIPEPGKSRCFDGLRAADQLTHERLLAFSRQPHEMARELAGVEVGLVRFPGAPCPLCQFPTYAWADLRRARELEEIVRRVRPPWSARDGLCERCADYFELVPIGGWP